MLFIIPALALFNVDREFCFKLSPWLLLDYLSSSPNKIIRYKNNDHFDKEKGMRVSRLDESFIVIHQFLQEGVWTCFGDFATVHGFPCCKWSYILEWFIKTASEKGFHCVCVVKRNKNRKCRVSCVSLVELVCISIHACVNLKKSIAILRKVCPTESNDCTHSVMLLLLAYKVAYWYLWWSWLRRKCKPLLTHDAYHVSL